MKKISIYCFLFLCGCPVEPQDVQAPEQGSPPAPNNPEDASANNNPAQNNGRPPGTPPTQDGQPPQNGGNGPQQPLNGAEPLQEGMNQGTAPEAGTDANAVDTEVNVDGTDQPAGENPSQAPNAGPQDGTGTPPEIPSGAMPSFNTPPSFGTLIGEGEAITVTLQVTGAESYNMEFLMAQEVDGRMSPRVLHMEKSVTANTSVRAPANYEYPVWLIITSDLTGDGPSDDDLIGGTTEPITFGTEDLSIDVTLQSDDDWMSQVPWYTKGLEDGPSATP